MTDLKDTNCTELVDAKYYGEHGPPHDLWTQIRNEDPVHWCEPDGLPPYWAITTHDDIVDVSTKPNSFLSEPGIVLVPEQEYSEEGIGSMRTIIMMDPPEHRDYRKVTAPYFTPRALRQLDEAIEESAIAVIDGLAEKGPGAEFDWATDVAAAHPLRVLSTILGVPRSEEPLILRLTNQLFASDDPELQREGSQEDRDAAMAELGAELFALFEGVIADRRANPTDDLASVIANGEVNGEPMGPMETFGYLLIAFTAGHDTTKNALAGGLHAFIENRDQLAKLRDEPELIDLAVEEAVRWSSPVNYMMRTCAEDTELHGKSIKKGDRLILFYASANRDETVFDDPFTFRIDRDPNRHLGFGIGEHFCLGSHLARASQKALLQQVANRVESIEPTADPQWISSPFVVGYKHIPVRVTISS
ncbi:MAG: cytochrome P450 [Acidobacteria bacterium]|nr:cytochrome P450 [Acidobacteriota bacterium]